MELKQKNKNRKKGKRTVSIGTGRNAVRVQTGYI